MHILQNNFGLSDIPEVIQRTSNGLAVFWPTMDLAEISIYGGLIFALSHEHVFELTTAYAAT